MVLIALLFALGAEVHTIEPDQRADGMQGILAVMRPCMYCAIPSAGFEWNDRRLRPEGRRFCLQTPVLAREGEGAQGAQELSRKLEKVKMRLNQ